MLRPFHRNQLIDLLRGLSLLMVIASHFGLLNSLVNPSGKIFWGRPVDDILAGMGFYGVAVFFVISGFLITGLSLRRYPMLGQISLRGFWWMRFCRLAPMLVLCVLAILLFSRLGLDGFTFRSPENFHRTLTKLFTFRFNELVGKDVSPEPWSPLWSLSVEEMFYWGFPLLCWALAARSTLSWMMLALIAISSCLKAAKLAGAYSTLGNMDLLSLGCLLALARPERLGQWSSSAVRRWTGLLCAATGGGIIIFCVLWAHPFRPYWAPEICGIGAVLFLIASQLLTVPVRAGKILLPLTILGVISYEAYLVHQPLRQYLDLFAITDVWLVLLLVIALSLALHVYFSEPLNLALRQVRESRPPPRSQNPLVQAGLSETRPTAPSHNPVVYGGIGGARPPAFAKASAGRPGALAHPRPSPTWWLTHTLIPVAALCGAAWFAAPTYIPPFALHFTSVKDLPAGTVEPLAYIGQPGNGKLVFLEHEAAGKVVVGIDEWNRRGERSLPLPAAALTGSDLRIDFNLAGVIVSQGAAVVVRSYSPPYRQAGQPRIGINDIGFSRATPHASSVFAISP